MSRAPNPIASPRLLRLLLGLCALALATCDSLWTPFQGANPDNCVASPEHCPEGQVCNLLTKLCQAPPSFSTLSLIAGGLGASGDGVGAEARFNGPFEVIYDGVGALYVADTRNHVIRKVAISTRMVTTIGGLAGMPGSADGQGATARFRDPCGLALDRVGNLYVVDGNNHTIRKVDVKTGDVTTLFGISGVPGAADGTGAAARFKGPYGVTYDGDDALYVTDYGNHTIRKAVLSTRVVSTIAGAAGASGGADGVGAAARFNYPYGLTLDSTGTLYVADYAGHTIRKVVPSTRTVTTLAGLTGMPGTNDGVGTLARFNGPTGVSPGGAGILYVIDNESHTIRKIVLGSGTVTTFAGLAGQIGSTDGPVAGARFNRPHGIMYDGAGSLFLPDSGNHTIRQIALATATVTTLAGTAGQPATLDTGGSADGVGAAAGFKGPSGLAFDGADTIYVSDAGNHTIRRVNASTGEVTTLAGSVGMTGSADGASANARFDVPGGVVADGMGGLYVADRRNQLIRKVILGTGAVETLAGTVGMAGSRDGQGTNAQFNFPLGLAFDGVDTLFVADTFNHVIRQVSVSSRMVSTLAGTAGVSGSQDATGLDARFYSPTGLVFDRAGTLYVADAFNHTIRAIQLSTRKVTTLLGAAGVPGSKDGVGASVRLNLPYGIAFDGAGTLYIADTGNNTIRKLDLRSNVVTTVVGTPGAAGVRLGMLPGRLNGAYWVAVSPTGRLFISEAVENAILRVD